MSVRAVERGDSSSGGSAASRTATPAGLLVPGLLGTAALAAVVLRFGSAPDLPAWIWFVLVGLILGVIDVREHRLPNHLILPGIVVAALLLTGAALAADRWDDLGRGLLAGLACFGLILVMALISPAGLGMGDVKLVALTGLYLGWLGWPIVFTGLLTGFLAQSVLGLLALAARRAGLKSDLPFGPALLVGALAATLLQGPWAVPLW